MPRPWNNSQRPEKLVHKVPLVGNRFPPWLTASTPGSSSTRNRRRCRWRRSRRNSRRETRPTPPTKTAAFFLQAKRGACFPLLFTPFPPLSHRRPTAAFFPLDAAHLAIRSSRGVKAGEEFAKELVLVLLPADVFGALGNIVDSAHTMQRRPVTRRRPRWGVGAMVSAEPGHWQRARSALPLEVLDRQGPAAILVHRLKGLPHHADARLAHGWLHPRARRRAP